jgi:hypothetical protein
MESSEDKDEAIQGVLRTVFRRVFDTAIHILLYARVCAVVLVVLSIMEVLSPKSCVTATQVKWY